MLKDQHTRDPRIAVVHATLAEADAYCGKFGQTTLVLDASANPRVYQQRIHDGYTMGGWLTGHNSFRMPALPFARAFTITPLTIPQIGALPPVQINHNFGFFPMVQVLAVNGAVRTQEVNIVHLDEFNLSLIMQNAQEVDATVLLR